MLTHSLIILLFAAQFVCAFFCSTGSLDATCSIQGNVSGSFAINNCTNIEFLKGSIVFADFLYFDCSGQISVQPMALIVARHIRWTAAGISIEGTVNTDNSSTSTIGTGDVATGASV